MNWKLNRKTQTDMKTELAKIEGRICEKFLLMGSVAKDFKLIEDLGLIPADKFDDYLTTWGFDRETVKLALSAQSVYADIASELDPKFVIDLEFASLFLNLNQNERKKLAREIKGKPISGKIVQDTKAKLFPLKCLS